MTARTKQRLTLIDSLLASAETYPEKPALFYQEKTISYGELADSVQRLAAGFSALGISKGDRVALLLPNCPEFVMSYYALTAIGGVCCPSNVLLKTEELAYVLGDAGVKAAVSARQLVPALSGLKERLPGLEYVINVGEGSLEAGIEFASLMTHGSMDLAGRVSPGDAAAILYTSGTTGKPKGAVLTQRSIVWDATACIEAINLTAQENMLCVLPLFHSFGATVCMVLPVVLGASTTLVDRFVPSLVVDAMQRHRVTIFAGVPTMYAALLQVPGLTGCDLSSLWLGITGGAAMPQSLQEAAQRALNITIIEGYGPTECSPVVSVNRVSKCKIGSVGVPLPGVEVRICDHEGVCVSAGGVGEIEVRGLNVMLGYHNRSPETAQALRDGWFRTGDLGKFDEDGFLYVVGRKKDMIIVGGLNVYPREVEDVLYGHPKVAEAAVLGVPDGLRGEIPKAFVAVKPGETLTEREMVRYCRERLANYKVPRAVEFRESLPKSGSGKVIKRALLDPQAAIADEV